MLRLLHKTQLYFHTLRYLKFSQVSGRLFLKRSKLDLRLPPVVRQHSFFWHPPVVKQVSILSPKRFRFLNVEHEIKGVNDWNNHELPKLWLYNLHYFDDLNAVGALNRLEWHRELIIRWMRENPPGFGVGWEPYPLSLRIINLIKWSLVPNKLDDEMLHSLAIQVRYLTNHLEYHLLGNHLFTNAKALVFAGIYFEGDEAASWLRMGMEILGREVSEQILEDGGHFERSTMYHALAYEDMLDLINLFRLNNINILPWPEMVSSWPQVIKKMGDWLQGMTHPDGEIAFFNDSAIGVAPSTALLRAYSERLALQQVIIDDGVLWFHASGYIRVVVGAAILLIDVAKIGPDYLPGHAHADTLSYELSVFGRRVVVNSGTSCYGLGPERKWERSTAAHNTVEIDGQDSSEVWGSFRVARRAYPFDISIKQESNVVIVDAAHNGYCRLPGRPVHRRRWILGANGLEVIDFIEGQFRSAVSRVFFHPDFMVLQNIDSSGIAQCEEFNLDWQADSAKATVRASTWASEFGLKIDNVCIELTTSNNSVFFSLNW